MKSWRVITAIVTLLVLGVGANASRAQDQHGGAKHGPKDQALGFPKCPVMDESVDFSVKVDTKDGPVYFCCKGCIEKYEAKPEKFAKNVASQRKAVAALPKVQVACPISGKPIDKKVSIKHNGETVYFCCAGCAPKFEKDPKEYASKLADSYTYQTKCPVMGGDIDPTAFSTLPGGRKVFYCCPGCDKPFLADPARYASKLEAQGFKIDLDKMKSDRKGKQAKHDDHDSHDHDH